MKYWKDPLLKKKATSALFRAPPSRHGRDKNRNGRRSRRWRNNERSVLVSPRGQPIDRPRGVRSCVLRWALRRYAIKKMAYFVRGLFAPPDAVKSDRADRTELAALQDQTVGVFRQGGWETPARKEAFGSLPLTHGFPKLAGHAASFSNFHTRARLSTGKNLTNKNLTNKHTEVWIFFFEHKKCF